MGEKPGKVAVIFHTGGSSAPAPTAPGGVVEFLLFRTTTASSQGEASERVKSLLAQRGSLDAVVAMRTIPDAKGVISGETEWMFPTSAIQSGNVILPRELEAMNQGTHLEMHCLTWDATGMEMEFILEHDLAKPEMPVATGEGASLLSRSDIKSYTIRHRGKLTLVPNTWTALGEIPLSSILPSAQNQSSYLFGRPIPDKP